MKQFDKLCCALLSMAMLLLLTACGGAQKTDDADTGDSAAAYLSITCDAADGTAQNGHEIQYYTYDLNTGELTMQAAIPYDADYAVGATNLFTNTLYYSSRETPNDEYSDDCIYAYDIASGEKEIIHRGEWSYNDISVIDETHLLVSIFRDDRTIQPAVIDLTTNEVTFLLENGESGYTLGLRTRLHYDYAGGSIACLLFNQSEQRSPAFNSGETEMDRLALRMEPDAPITLADAMTGAAVLTKDYAFEESFALQLSDTEMLFCMREFVNEDSVNRYYRGTFSDGGNTMQEVDSPFSEGMQVRDCMTIDGGTTYYCLGRYLHEGGNSCNGLFLWDSRDDTITPIFSNGKEGNVISFTLTQEK